MSADEKTVMEENKQTRNITVALLGNVDAGKSSVLGVLISKKPDNGKGLSRSLVFKHPHELKTGRTSDISIKDAHYSQNHITFCDLAGHEMYFKTTVSGMTSNYPDLVLLCVDHIITRSTREHLGLAIRMNIPILILITKTDLRSEEIIQTTIKNLKDLINRHIKRQVFEIKKTADVTTVIRSPGTIGLLRISNINLAGHDMLADYLSQYSVNFEKHKIFPEKFTISSVYFVNGVGTVVCGYNGGAPIEVGSTMYLGPIKGTDTFEKVEVKSIHDDFKTSIAKLQTGVRGCLAIRVKCPRHLIKYGSVVSFNLPPTYELFTTKIKILTSNHSTINAGFSAILNLHSMREPISVVEVLESEKNDTTKHCVFKFAKGPKYIEVGQHFFAREGGLVLEGFITKLGYEPIQKNELKL